MQRQLRANMSVVPTPGLPRPRELELTYTKGFTDIVLELREHIGAIRKPLTAVGPPAAVEIAQ